MTVRIFARTTYVDSLDTSNVSSGDLMSQVEFVTLLVNLEFHI